MNDTVLPANDLAGFRVHMAGIGGSGMSGLAALLLRHGAHVTGADACGSPVIDRLIESGAQITIGGDSASLPHDAQLLVASAAIPTHHPEVVAATERHTPIVKYARLLGELMGRFHGIAVSGTHGKSTTTAWLAYVLHCAGFDPTFVVGAVSEQLGGGSGAGGGPHFVAEACEYDRSFLNLQPQSAAILNVEEDHLDCYADLEAIQLAFTEFAQRLPDDGLLVINGDDPGCAPVRAAARTETFGLSEGCEWRAVDLSARNGFYSFELLRDGRRLGRMQLGVAGKHNVYNALAVIALAQRADAPITAIRDGLRDYRGVGRRLELRADVDGVCVVDDYAHHPAEIRATLLAARERFEPRRLWCVFQPHQHSRTRFLLDDFAASFELADEIIVPDIYFVRDSARERESVSAQDLVTRIAQRGGRARYVAEFSDIVELLSEEVQPGDVVITMGAGTIWKAADELVRRLRGDLST